MPKGVPWTREEEKQLRELVLAHRPLGVIAGSLGKTKESIRCKMARMGLVDDNQPKSERSLSTKLKLPVDLPSVEEEKQLKALVESNKPVGVIAETLEKTVDSVKSKIRRLGLVEEGEVKKQAPSSSKLILP